MKTEKSNDDILQDQLLNQICTNDDSTSVVPLAIVPSEAREDPLQEEFLTKFTFEELKATRRLQSEWVQRCTETDVMKNAIIKGNLDNVKWIWKQNSNDWDNYKDVNIFFPLAARKGHFEVLKWLHAQNCPEGSIKVNDASTSQTNAFSMAAGYGSLEMIKWLKEKGYEGDEWSFGAAAKNTGSLDKLKWLKEVGCVWNGNSSWNMVRHGSLENIIWAKDSGLTFEANSYMAAAEIGNLKIMKWLKNNGVPMDGRCFAMAAKHGNMEMMKWLVEQNCPWSKDGGKEAAEYARKMLKWLKTNKIV